MLDRDKYQKIANEESKYKIQCSCGTKTVMIEADRTICRGCGHWIYRNKQIEFKYKLKGRLKCLN